MVNQLLMEWRGEAQGSKAGFALKRRLWHAGMQGMMYLVTAGTAVLLLWLIGFICW